MVKNNVNQGTAERIWNFIEPFARYGFNKSHSACYATIGYQTAYLKAHYPTEFMAALMNSEASDIERIAQLIKECTGMGITVLPPDINESFTNFTVVDDKNIRFGLTAIKNVGSNVVNTIVEERKANGEFKSIENFVTRVESRDLNKKSLESLAKCGAMDKLSERKKFLENMENILKFARDSQKSKTEGQFSLFDGMQNESPISFLRLQDVKPAEKSEKLLWEKELLGLYISEHPLEDFKNILNALDSIQNIREKQSGDVTCAGIINKIKKINTKQNQAMLFVEIEDLTGQIEVIVFPRALEANPLLWQNDKIIVIKGYMNDKDGVPKIITNKAVFIENYRPKADQPRAGTIISSTISPRNNKPIVKSIHITLPKKFNDGLMQEIQKIFIGRSLGSTKVVISIPNGGSRPDAIETPYKIKYDESILKKLNELGINDINVE